MKLVIIESPYSGNIVKNTTYARKCIKDCLSKGESAFASHLLYTQEGILEDSKSDERKLGIKAGLAWGKVAYKTVVYQDLGISKGMQIGIDTAIEDGRIVEYRNLPGWSDDDDPEREAKIAYQAYGDTTDWKNYLGLPMPVWTELPDKIREAWVAAAKALTK